MRLKVDENLPREICDLLQSAGHDATSVGEQGLGGAGDARIYQLCQDEQRALLTLDVDFANVQAYDPKSSFGAIVLRLARQDRARVLDALARALPVLEREPLAKRLWIVEEDRISIRASADGTETTSRSRGKTCGRDGRSKRVLEAVVVQYPRLRPRLPALTAPSRARGGGWS